MPAALQAIMALLRPAAGGGTNYLLQEDGFRLNQEDGFGLLIEAAVDRSLSGETLTVTPFIVEGTVSTTGGAEPDNALTGAAGEFLTGASGEYLTGV